MNKIFNFLKKDTFAISLIFLMVFSRLIHHPPNFTPIIAVAIMSGYLFRNFYLSFLVLVISMLISDLFLGFYNLIFFVYISLFLINYIFFKIKTLINYKNLLFFSIIGSLIFFLISNFGVWFLGSLYEKSLTGLVECYILAIPFFLNTLLSTIFFSYSSFIFFNIFEKKLFKKIS